MAKVLPTPPEYNSPLPSFDRHYLNLLPIFVLLIFTFHLFAGSKNPQQTIFYLTILAPGLYLLIKNFSDKDKLKILLPCALFLSYSAITTLWTEGKAIETIVQPFKNSVYIFIFLYCLLYLDIDKQVTNLIKFLVLVAAISALVTCYNAFLVQGIEFGKRMGGSGNLAHPLRVGTLYGFFTVCNCYLLIRAKHNSLAENLLFSATFLILLFSMAATISRTPFAATAICLFLLCVFNFNKPAKFILLFGITLIATVLLLLPDALSSYTARGMSYRPLIWKDAINSIMQAPILGHGILSEINIPSIQSDSAHNRFLSTFYYSGVVGLILLLVVIADTFIKNIKSQSFELFSFKVLLLFGCLCSLTEGKYVISRPDMVWLIIWLPLGLTLNAYLKSSVPNNTKNI